MNDNVCIIGGSGFIGTRFAQLLKGRGMPFSILDKAESKTFPELTLLRDIRDAEGLTASLPPCGLVVHLAAEHRDDVTPVSLYHDVNVTGTQNLLDAMDRAGITRILFTSTVAVYGLGRDNPDESAAPAPFNPYGATKLQAEELIRAWQARDPNRCAVVLRPSVVFGENNRGNVYNLLKQISSGRFLMVGNGKNIKSMAYVGNVAAFMLHIAEQAGPGYHLYNYTDRPDLEVHELVALARSEMGLQSRPLTLHYAVGMAAGRIFDLAAGITDKKFSISSIRIKKFCSSTRFDSTRAHATGFRAPFALTDALRSTIRHELPRKSS